MKKLLRLSLAMTLIIVVLAGAMGSSSPVQAAEPTMEGHGLLGEFYRCVPNPSNREDISVFTFDDLRGEKVVGSLNGDSFTSIFNQITGSPDYNTARFTGTIVPQYSEEYTFHLVGDDGFRLWIDGQLMIDFWEQKWELPQASAPIMLTANQHYDIKIEYLQGWGGAWMKLEWESDSQAREVVPESALYLPADRIMDAKQQELAVEIQKADDLIASTVEQVSADAQEALQAKVTAARELLAMLEDAEELDRSIIEQISAVILDVSIARASLMKELNVTTSSIFRKFNNPLYQGQDPFVTYKDGFYYFVSSSNLDSNNKVYVSKSRTLTDQGEKVMVFDSKGTQTRIFAPEIFFLDGKWYIYYCADIDEYGYRHMAAVLESVTDDPQGEYEYKGVLYTGVGGDYRQANDITVFEHEDQLYAVWGTLGAGEPIGPAIARMDNPYTITEDRSILSGGGGEGPRVLQKDGRMFITTSEGDYQSNGYRLSYFMYQGGDVLSADSWSFTRDVFISTNDVSGPARAWFTTSPDGTEDWMIYHSRVYKDTERNWWRQVNIKKFDWNTDGTPNFGQPVSPAKWLDLPAGDPGQGDMYQAEDALHVNGVTVNNANANYQGAGYVQVPNSLGAELNFIVEAEEAGDYIVGARYAYGVAVNGESTNHPTVQLPARAKLEIYVNGEYAKSIAVDKTALSWEEWFTGSERLTLEEGKNIISYRIDNGSIGNVNIDYVTMYKADVPSAPVDPEEPETPEDGLTGDLNGDEKLTVGDLGIMASSYGITADSSDWELVQHADLNDDGVINEEDILQLMNIIRSSD